MTLSIRSILEEIMKRKTWISWEIRQKDMQNILEENKKITTLRNDKIFDRENRHIKYKSSFINEDKLQSKQKRLQSDLNELKVQKLTRGSRAKY
jgi:Rps23 Pro-64 3,4-dihydroxylase Tpa1-like proline 4-hydroxylase